jgi:cell division protein ZipA
MDGLRWLLLLFGVLLIAGVYLYSRRERDRPAKKIPSSGQRIPPTLDEDSAEPYIEDGDAISGEDESKSDDADRNPLPQKIVTLRLVAHNRDAFRGDELILALRGIGMRHGKFGIFHRFDGNDETKIVFSAASLVEPGSFDLINIQEQQIPGISLFLIMPGPLDGAEAFDIMMVVARSLAQTMDAELLDESGSNMSIQRERYMREEIIQYQHSNQVS